MSTERDFFDGLKNEDDRREEDIASAEHFVRLKKQMGHYDPPAEEEDLVEKLANFEDEHATAPVIHEEPKKSRHGMGYLPSDDAKQKMDEAKKKLREKTAKIFGHKEPASIHHAAIPHEDRSADFKKFIDNKAAEKPTGYGTASLVGGGVGAGLGALLNRSGMRRGGAILGGIAGAGTGALLAKRDRKNISKAKQVAHEGSYGNAMNASITRRAENDRYDDRTHRLESTLHHISERSKLASDLRAAAQRLEKRAMWYPATASELSQAISRLGTPTPGKMKQETEKKEHEKKADMMGVAKDPATLMFAVPGAIAGGLATYLRSRPKEEHGGKSADEVMYEDAVDAQKKHPEKGLLQKVKNRSTEAAHGYATAFREHPMKSTALGALLGGATGFSIAQALGAHRIKGV